MKSHLLITSLALLFCSQILFAQFQNVTIFYNTGYWPNEPTVMINPKNVNQVVVGANAFYSNSLSGVYHSTNGGLNWNGGGLISIIAKPSGDPVVFTDTAGNFFFISLTNYGLPLQWKGLIIQKSTNGGANWNNGTYIAVDTNKMHDKPWGCCDFSNSIYGNSIYMAWTLFDVYGSHNPQDSSNIMFVRSTDGGTTFSLPKRINRQAGNCYDSSLTVEGTSLCTGPNGEVYVVWAGPLGVTVNRSTDGGITWLSSEIVISEVVGGWGRGNGFPIICCDLSNSQYRGRLYVNWMDKYNGVNDRDVWCARSTDGGFTWSQRVKVNTDQPGNDHRYNWMSLDRVTGYVYFQYLDKRNYSPSSSSYDVFVARTTDGGTTFQDTRVNTSTVSSAPCWLGDYMNISAYNNKVRPVWITCLGNYNYMMTAIIDSFYVIGIQKISDKIPAFFNLYQNYPNPFNPTTKIRYQIPKGSNVVLKVYDLLGREVAVLVNEKQAPGIYEVDWDASNYPSGVYFYKLIAGDYHETKRMVLIK